MIMRKRQIIQKQTENNFWLETTEWSDNIPNHVYLLNSSKSKMIGYVRHGTNELKIFNKPIGIDMRRRKFVPVPNTYGYVEAANDAVIERHEVKGSKGDTYIVEKIDNAWSCSCAGFKFRGECKHIKEFDK